MLRRLRVWAEGEAPGGSAVGSSPAPERRLDVRLDFSGTIILVRRGRMHMSLQLKDVSAEGACGISEVPLAVGTTIFLQLRRPHFHAATIVWVRHARVGLKFVRPLDPDDLLRLHGARKAIP